MDNRAGIGSALCRKFQNLFASGGSSCPKDLEGLITQCIPAEAHVDLVAILTDEEIRGALFEMDPNKAPGPDGLRGIFFRSYWQTVQKDVIDIVREFFITRHLLPKLNEANIVLILKVDVLSKLKDYRPISLCNVV